MKLAKSLVLSLVLPQLASAAGLWLYEVGTPEMGTAGAGRGAVANSASTAAFNPAGMTRLNESELMLGFQPMYIDTKFSGEATDNLGSPISGGNGSNAGGFVPSGGVFYVHSYSEDVKFGLSFASFFGLGLDYGDSWKGRNFVTEAELLTMALTPSVAYKLNKEFSVGLSLNILYSSLDQKFIGPLGNKRSLESDDIGLGFGLSCLYEPSQDTRFGLLYTSEIKQDFDDVSGDVDIDLEMNTPQSLTLSAYHDIDSEWALLGSLGWQDWSEFGKSSFSGAINLEDDRNFDDTYHISIGTHYKYSEPLTLMAGVAYDSSPVSNGDRTVDLPIDEQIRYAMGMTYQYSKRITFGTAYELIDLGDAKVNQTQLGNNIEGKYNTNYLHILNINMNYKF